MGKPTVRRSIFLLLLLNSGLVFGPAKTAGDEVKNKITRQIKNGIVEVLIENNEVKLTLENNDKSYKKDSTLFTTSEDDVSGTTTFVECGNFRICFSNKASMEMTIETNPEKETIQITQRAGLISRLMTCFKMNDNEQWFGGPQLRYQHWPIQHMYFDEEPYVPIEKYNMAIAERYWLSSEGFYILVNKTVPLFLDQNNHYDKHICLIAEHKKPYISRDNLEMSYEIGFFGNPKTAHQYVVKNHFGNPTGYPDERMIRHPIWSTWARYKVNINEKVVQEFADEIIANGYNNSQLEIDDNWETCYGSAVFDTKVFPNITRLSNELKRKGFRVTLWIHPFINEGCEPAYTEASRNQYFVKNLNGSLHTTWWQGSKGAAVIDFTNPRAVSWWVGRLKALQNLGIDSFKFDAGEVSWMPQIASLNTSKSLHPGIFTRDYVTALAQNFDLVIEARVGWNTQTLPIFIRMIDKDSTWTFNNGLPTLITTLLQMNMNGYIHVLPDMVGGNGYAENPLNSSILPPKELFVRWLQANTFMPSIQYSFVPWDYDAETNAICKMYTNLHANLTSTIVRAMKQAMNTSSPLNGPIWWVDPKNPEAHKINDEYLLGEEILVAPIIHAGAVSRNIFLPGGKWRDANTNIVYNGPLWLNNYHAPLSVLPYFYRI